MKMKLQSKILITLIIIGCIPGWAARADAPATWTTNCASCHGKDGKGSTMMGRKLGIGDLTDPKVQAGFTDADATKDIKEGVKVDGKEVMKPYGSKLSDAQVKELVAYIRSLK